LISTPSLNVATFCAGASFNSFYTTFSYSGFTGSTNFVVEFSDELGSFANPILPTILTSTDIAAGTRKIEFALPKTLAGSEIYKLRIKETNLGKISSTSAKFAAYYKQFEASFFINNKQQTATICNVGGKVTLSIDTATPAFPSPVDPSKPEYKNLKYKWYKVTTPVDLVVGTSTSSTFIADVAGDYYAVIDYGKCIDANFKSNIVTVNILGSGTSGTITTNPTGPFCSQNGLTTLTPSVAGNSYQWYLNDNGNNAIIDGATQKEYKTDKPGIYSVQIDFGGCKDTYSITLTEKQITASINSPAVAVGDVVTVTTGNITTPKFEWFINDTAIQGATGSSYIPIVKGNFKVRVSETVGCGVFKEIPFTVIDFSDIQLIPNLISPNNDGTNDTWIIPQEYLTGSNAEIVIYDSQGQVVLQTNNYQNNFPIDPIDFGAINPVYYYTITTKDQGVKKGSITVVK
jgi:gliding motility-associated-like protein